MFGARVQILHVCEKMNKLNWFPDSNVKFKRKPDVSQNIDGKSSRQFFVSNVELSALLQQVERRQARLMETLEDHEDLQLKSLLEDCGCEEWISRAILVHIHEMKYEMYASVNK